MLLNLLVVTSLPIAGGLPESVAFGVAIGLQLVCLGAIAVIAASEEAAGGASVELKRPGSYTDRLREADERAGDDASGSAAATGEGGEAERLVPKTPVSAAACAAGAAAGVSEGGGSGSRGKSSADACGRSWSSVVVSPAVKPGSAGKRRGNT